MVTGARQTGKSSLLRRLAPNAQYVSFDNALLADEAEHNPEAFLKRLANPVIIDEIQYVSSIFRELKRVIDSDRESPGRFFLAGSQQFSLLKGFTESLAGRISIFDLATLSAQELRAATLSPRDLPQRGGFPELWVYPDQQSLRFFGDYITTYLERELGVSANTAMRWVDALNATGIIRLLEPWHTKEARRLIKTPKLYFRDNGILCHLLRVHQSQDWRTHALAGQIWENFVFNEISRFLEWAGTPHAVWFWRQKDGHEINFVVEHAGITTLIEAKLSERPDKREFRFEKFPVTPSTAPKIRRAVACLQREGRSIGQADFTTFNPLDTSLLELWDTLTGVQKNKTTSPQS